MDFYKVPINFGLALAGNAASMNRYAHMTKEQKQDMLNKTYNVRSEKEMYTLVASIANGFIESCEKTGLLIPSFQAVYV